MTHKLRVLIGCEFSGIIRDAFLERGHDAMSCDVLETEREGPHYTGDVRDILHDGFDLAIFHPPCTYLANSGVRWLWTRDGEGKRVKVLDRWEELDKAAAFFRELMDAPIPRIAIENPIPHKHAVERIGSKPDIVTQPWHFGHPETKATCFWLKNLPPLMATCIVAGREGRVWKESPGPDRWKRRSRTYPGLAEALADQWGALHPIGE